VKTAYVIFHNNVARS